MYFDLTTRHLALLLATSLTLPSGAVLASKPRSEELRAVSSDEVSLAGTLYVPAGSGPFPVVIFTHGSEPGRRTQRGYVRWAERFRDRGVAGLVFDKRGVGDSEGHYIEAPDLEVPAGDVLAWAELLAGRSDIRKDAIGVMGWSQGGWVGPLAAARSGRIAFVVSISGPGVSPLEQNIFDKTHRFRATGASPERVEEFSRVIRRVWTYLVTGEDRREAQAAWDGVQDRSWFREGYNGPPMMDRDKILGSPRMKHYVAHSSYEPVPILETLRIPMLAIFGKEDAVVPVQASIDAMTDAFRRAGNPDFTYKIVPGHGHGIPMSARVEGGNIGELVTAWVADQVSAPE